jgi:cysteinyl-tRNA synthetase
MDIRLHNTLTGAKEPFAPVDPSDVRMYVCGPTVYDSAHLGNARPVVVFDTLFRLLRTAWPRVTYVRNVTDVDDKIIARAGETGESIQGLTARTFAAFSDDTVALGALPPTHQPRATEHIGTMIEFVMELLAKEHAYVADRHVLFSVASIRAFGALSGKSLDGLRVGASARGEPAPYKRDPMDFVLWKPARRGEPSWDSPWGKGRPGWHIECSAMSRAYLGDLFDIHGGGQDLVFPHHENEIAQTTAATGQDRMANFWLHNGFVTVDGRKMSKSLGNVVTVRDVLARDPSAGAALRLLLLSTHYRQDFDFTWERVAEAARKLRWLGERLAPGRGAGDGPVDDGVLRALADDLNTPLALTRLHTLADAAARANPSDREHLAADGVRAAALLGLDLWAYDGAAVDRDWVEGMLESRAAARAAKDWAAADAIRAELAAAGVAIEDGPGGATRWKRAV